MRVHVAALRHEAGRQRGLQEELHWEPLQFQGEWIGFPAPLRLEATLANTGTAISLSGTVRGRLTLQCQRCLAPVSQELKADLAAWYQTPPQAEEAPLADAVEHLEVYEGQTVDLTEAIREAILLALPVKRLCSETCKGLCPVCGQNRNEHNCECSVKETDPRLDKLREWNLNR